MYNYILQSANISGSTLKLGIERRLAAWMKSDPVFHVARDVDQDFAVGNRGGITPIPMRSEGYSPTYDRSRASSPQSPQGKPHTLRLVEVFRVLANRKKGCCRENKKNYLNTHSFYFILLIF